MLSSRVKLLPFVLLAASLNCLAQAPDVPPGPPPPGWVPQSVEALGEHATFHNTFTFDRSMIRFANNFMSDGDEDTKAAAGKLDSISVHVFHYSAPGMYDPALLGTIRREYDATGWKHLMTAHPKGDPFHSGETDLWISFADMQVTGMTVLLAGQKDVEVISVLGNLSPLDLLHLRGHFGIPRFDADNLGPAPRDAQPPPSQPPSQPRPEYQEPQPAPPPPNL